MQCHWQADGSAGGESTLYVRKSGREEHEIRAHVPERPRKREGKLGRKKLKAKARKYRGERYLHDHLGVREGITPSSTRRRARFL